MAVICAAFILTATCATETIAKESRKTESFSKISARDGIDVYYTQSDSYSVVVEAKDDYIGKIITKVEGETLVIKLEGWMKIPFWKRVFGSNAMTVSVAAPALYKVDASGGADFYADNLKCDSSFQLNLSAGADVKIANLTVAGNVGIAVSAGADVAIDNLTVAGNAGISTSAGADCDVKKLQATECSLSAGEGSDINISMELSGGLTATASSGADIDISGKAGAASLSASSGADINIRKLACKSVNIYQSSGGGVHR
ncbi:MAG: DUF2807 domain-containing protein [Prevotellaceae bacterium]|nr:DUF2807 domain-containing protein [Prevotellaceae bacterium]